MSTNFAVLEEAIVYYQNINMCQWFLEDYSSSIKIKMSLGKIESFISKQ